MKTAEVFSVTIGKDCTLESCQACACEENYKHDPRPPSPKDSEAAALKEAIDLRHELESGGRISVFTPRLSTLSTELLQVG